MESLCEVKKWINIFSSNYKKIGENTTTYEFCCKIPDIVKDELMLKQGDGQKFIGCTIQVDLFSDNTVTPVLNSLVIFTLQKKDKLYYITNTYYKINDNIVINYEEQIKSKYCYDLNIVLNDLLLNNVFFETGSKFEKMYMKTRISKYNTSEIVDAKTYIYRDKKIYSIGAMYSNNVNNNIPVSYAIQISKSKSIKKFSKNIEY